MKEREKRENDAETDADTWGGVAEESRGSLVDEKDKEKESAQGKEEGRGEEECSIKSIHMRSSLLYNTHTHTQGF